MNIGNKGCLLSLILLSDPCRKQCNPYCSKAAGESRPGNTSKLPEFGDPAPHSGSPWAVYLWWCWVVPSLPTLPQLNTRAGVAAVMWGSGTHRAVVTSLSQTHYSFVVLFPLQGGN